MYSHTLGKCAKVVSKCEAAKCGPNSGCFEDFADCNFEQGQCGWTPDTNGWKMARSGQPTTTLNGNTEIKNPGHDHTFGDNEAAPKGHYFLLSSDTWSRYAYLTTFTFPTKNVQAGLGCRFIFHFATEGRNSLLNLRMSPGLSETQTRPAYRNVWSAATYNKTGAGTGPWYTAAIYASDLAQFGDNAVAQFQGRRDASGYVAVDDIRLVCGDNQEEGVCMCEQGYHQESKDGEPLQCVIDKGEKPPAPLEIHR